MTFLPNDYQDSWTLASPIVEKGIGLHTGSAVEVRLKPSQKHGFHLSWIDKEDLPVKLEIGHVRDSPLCTTLEIGNHRLLTVEHLLAALSGCGLTHVDIQVLGEEVPLLDGSALKWVEAISKVGLVSASSPVPLPLQLERPLTVNRGKSFITAIPSEKFELIGIIDFPYPAIGKQMFAIELTPQSFIKEIAPARTFGFKDQIEKLKDEGLIKGGNLSNALVCDGDDWLNPPLRYCNEPVRHKILDLIGDLALVGFPNAQVLVFKGSHGLHADFANALVNECLSF